MNKINLFISYKYEDRNFVNSLKGLLQNPNNLYRHRGISENMDFRDRGSLAIKDYLKGEIRDCDALICLIGQDTHTSEWISYELEVAKSIGKKIVAVRIPQTSGGLPYLLKAWGISEINWDSKKINDALSSR